MQGTLGQFYRFFYSSKNYVPGLTNVMAKVKRPDDITLGVFTLVEVGDPDFAGTYYFDMVATQLMPEGEYTVIIKELASGFRQVSKVTMRLPTQTVDPGAQVDVIGTLVDSPSLVGSLEVDPQLVGQLVDEELAGVLISDDIINGQLMPDLFITGTLEECA